MEYQSRNVKLKRSVAHANSSRTLTTEKSMRLNGVTKGTFPASLFLFTSSADGAKRNDIDLDETRYRKILPRGKSYDAFAHYSSPMSFFKLHTLRVRVHVRAYHMCPPYLLH